MSWVRPVLALLLVGHGVAHLPGFIVAWRLRELPQLPYTTTVLAGAVDLGPVGTRMLGIGWLLTALGCLAAAVALVARTPWAGQLALAVIGFSTVLCVLGYPATKLGLVANAVIVTALLLTARWGWR